jgi:hypothetical protein
MGANSPISSAEVELLEAEAFAELHGQFAVEVGSEVASVKRWGRAAALASRSVDAVAINRAVGFGFEAPLDATQLAEVRDFFRQQGKSRWFVECSPDASIDRQALSAAGGVVGGSVIKLVGEMTMLGDVTDAGLDVQPVTRADAQRFMNLVGSQLGVPEAVRPGVVSTIGKAGWYFYFALKDRRPIAGAAMFVAGDGAWFGLAGTEPEHRNCGAQTALLVRRIRDARTAGCRWVSAETSPETVAPNHSLRNMRRLGLRQLYQRPWYRFHEDMTQS